MSDAALQPKWVAVDWGTSNLRVWAMGPDGHVLAARQSDAGMASLPRDGFEDALVAAIAPSAPTPNASRRQANTRLRSR